MRLHAERLIVAAVLIALSQGSLACAHPSEPDQVLGDVRQAVARGLNVVVNAASRYPENQSCFSCHHQTLPLLAAIAAREAGVDVDEQFIAAQAEFTHTSFDDDIENLRQGKGIGGRAMTVAYALWALRLADRSNDQITEAMTTYLLKTQHDDGHWSRQTGRPPLEESNLTCTTLAIYGLQRFGAATQMADVDAAIAKATIWLAETKPVSQEDRCFRLLSLHLLGGANDERANAQRLVVTAQRVDGGWAQLDDMDTDAYATGQTLYVLRMTGFDTTSDEYRRGVRFLLNCQHPDGSWFVKSRSKAVQPYFDNGDPHGKDQFISTPASAWAVAALAAALTPPTAADAGRGSRPSSE